MNIFKGRKENGQKAKSLIILKSSITIHVANMNVSFLLDYSLMFTIAPTRYCRAITYLAMRLELYDAFDHYVFIKNI